jgi:glc operon protein GlcG
MKKLVMASLAVCAGLVLGADARAQAADDPSKPPEKVPEAMPFDIPYGTPINADQARELVAAAVAEAKKHNWKLNVAVVDTNGDLVSFERMPDAQIASVTIAQGKARTAARYRRSTRLFFAAMEKGHPYVATLDPTLIASAGGLPLIVGGKLIGAIGCSGGTGDQDEAACMAGAKMAK